MTNSFRAVDKISYGIIYHYYSYGSPKYYTSYESIYYDNDSILCFPIGSSKDLITYINTL